MWTQLLIIAVVVGIAFWLVRWLATGKVSVRTPADWGIILLVFMAGVSSIITPLPETSIVQILRLLSGVLLFYAIVNWLQSARRTGALIAILALVGMSLSLFALISVEWAATKIQSLPYQIDKLFSILVSDTVHPNVMAGTLLLFAPVVFAVVIFNSWSSLAVSKNRIAYILSGIAFISITLILILTISRSAWIAYLVGMALLISMRWRWGWLSIVALISTAVLLLYLLNPADFLRTLLESQTLGSLAGRLEVWSRAVYMIEDFPVTGVGMGLYPNMAAFFYPLVIASVDTAVHAHNLFLQIAVDLGLPGLIAWLSILSVVFTVTWKLYREGKAKRDQWSAGLGAGLFCSTMALVMHGLMDSVVWGMVRPAPVVWVIWGTAIASSLVYVAMPDQQHPVR